MVAIGSDYPKVTMRARAVVLCLCLLILACSGFNVSVAAMAEVAGTSDELQPLLRQAKEKRLAQDRYWLRLLHFHYQIVDGVTIGSSQIVSSGFFLSRDGRTNPQTELEATLRAFFDPPGPDSNRHAQCRFVARLNWLRRSLDWGNLSLPFVRCPQYEKYSRDGQIESLSLVYATGFMSNPASYFGHILLKFNSNRTDVPTDLLDQSINYGAVIPENENQIVYAVRGLFGGYFASFSHRQFYQFTHAYAENELRDLWEYELVLSKNEVDQIVSHSWELLGQDFNYYFLSNNCAYQMAELLELVVHDNLLPDLPWSIPGTMFERIAKISHNRAPLVREIHKVPSLQNRFRQEFTELAPEEQRVVEQLVDHDLDFQSPDYERRSIPSKTAIIHTLIDYYQFRITIDKRDVRLPQLRQSLLVKRLDLPPAKDSRLDVSQPALVSASPDKGPLPLMAQISAISNSQQGGGSELHIRPGAFDQLQTDVGRVPDSKLAVFDLRLVYLNDRLTFRSLTFVDIETLNVAKTPLPHDGGLAWDFKFGLEQQNIECYECTVFRLGGGAGKAVAIGPHATVYGLLDLFGQTKYEDSGSTGIVPRVGLVAKVADVWKTYLSVGHLYYLNGDKSEYRVTRWENRFGTSRHWDIRVAYQEQVANEYSIGLAFYW